MYCLLQNIPRKYRPIYNLAMKGVLVCVTNISKEDRVSACVIMGNLERI